MIVLSTSVGNPPPPRASHSIRKHLNGQSVLCRCWFIVSLQSNLSRSQKPYVALLPGLATYLRYHTKALRSTENNVFSWHLSLLAQTPHCGALLLANKLHPNQSMRGLAPERLQQFQDIVIRKQGLLNLLRAYQSHRFRITIHQAILPTADLTNPLYNRRYFSRLRGNSLKTEL